MAAVLSIAEGVGDQVVQHTGHEQHVRLHLHRLRRVQRQLRARRGDQSLLLAHGLRQRAQVGALHVRFLRALLQPGDVQQLPDKTGHLLRLPPDHAHALLIVLCRGLCALQRIALCQNDGDGRPQLVAGVGGKLRLRLEGALQPVEHIVKGARQPVDLAFPPRQTDALRQVVAAGNALRRGDDLLHGLEGQAGYQPAAQRRHHHQTRQQRPRQRHDHVHDALSGGAVDGAPHPHGGAAHVQRPVVHIVPPAVAAGHCPQSLVGEGHLLRHRRRPRAAQQAPVLVVDLGIHPVAVELHVAEIPVPVVKFQIVGVALHHVHHLRLRRAGDAVAVHQHHEHQHQRGDGHHHHREPQGHAPLDRDVSHASSFSTQPMPRTVCSSLASPGSSSFFRR